MIGAATPVRTDSSRNMAERPELRRVEKLWSVRRLGPVDVTTLRAPVARLSDEAWERENAVKGDGFFCFALTLPLAFRFVSRD